MKHERSLPLNTGASKHCCAHCPPDRVCAWACVQGMALPDILVGVLLDDADSWALHMPPEPGLEAEQQALWDCFNA